MESGTDPSWLQAITAAGSDAVSALERENSHFEVAESIICALQQLRYKADNDSDEEDTLSDSIRDYAYSLTASQTSIPANCSPISPAILRKSVSIPVNSKESSAELSDWVRVVDTDTPSINTLSNDSISTVLEKFAENQSSDLNSPHIIARQLFSSLQFSSEESAELDWLVTEKSRQLPRALSDVSLPTRLRGNSDWAPPRAQIIYHMHLPNTRKSIMSRCGYRCAGCGMKIDNTLANWFRYCAYLGKYFCHSCHHEKIAFVPSRILHKWDFRKQRVSNFAADLLSKMYSEPLYCIQDINQGLYKSVSEMKTARALRFQLYFLSEYLRACRNGKDLLDNLSLRTHIISEPQLYSLEDLCAVKERTLIEEMKSLVTGWLQHVDNCGLCRGKGFICELCAKEEIIYPFQLETAIQCQMCWTCFHKACYADSCPKCARIRSRLTTTDQEKGDTASTPTTPTSADIDFPKPTPTTADIYDFPKPTPTTADIGFPNPTPTTADIGFPNPTPTTADIGFPNPTPTTADIYDFPNPTPTTADIYDFPKPTPTTADIDFPESTPNSPDIDFPETTLTAILIDFPETT